MIQIISHCRKISATSVFTTRFQCIYHKISSRVVKMSVTHFALFCINIYLQVFWRKASVFHFSIISRFIMQMIHYQRSGIFNYLCFHAFISTLLSWSPATPPKMTVRCNIWNIQKFESLNSIGVRMRIGDVRIELCKLGFVQNISCIGMTVDHRLDRRQFKIVRKFWMAKDI